MKKIFRTLALSALIIFMVFAIMPKPTAFACSSNAECGPCQFCTAAVNGVCTPYTNGCPAPNPTPLPTGNPPPSGGCPAGQTNPFTQCSGSAGVWSCISNPTCGVGQCDGGASQCASTYCPAPGPPPPPPVTTYTITGNVFVDTNGNGIKDVGEINYSGSITMTSTTGSITYGGVGAYTISGVSAGADTVSYTSIPAGYRMTKPINGPPPFYALTVGGTCSPGGSSGTCAGGSLSGVDFGITNAALPWIQSTGGNIRIDSGINNSIPANASASCGGPNMSLPGNGGQPGIIYSGNSSASFGSGQASAAPYNWMVTSPDGQKYTPPTPNTIRTSYGYLLSNASQQGNLTISDLLPYCTTGSLDNCTLSASIPRGIYKANGNLTIPSDHTFPAGAFVILVNGNLTIKGKILAPLGTVVVFSAAQDVLIDKGVGEATNTSASPDLQGIFSADRNFIVQGTNSCSIGPDLRLNVSGNIVANASYLGGSFQNQRNLCAGNTCPSISIAQNLNMIINIPPLLKAPNYIWQEIAP